MQIHYDGTDYEFDLEALTLSDARYIKRNTGLTVRGLLSGLEEVDPEALLAIYWLMLKQSGTAADINKLNFNILQFGSALGDALAAEAPDSEADPTEADEAAART